MVACKETRAFGRKPTRTVIHDIVDTKATSMYPVGSVTPGLAELGSWVEALNWILHAGIESVCIPENLVAGTYV